MDACSLFSNLSWKPRSEINLPEEKTRVVEDVHDLYIEVVHPCKNQFLYEEKNTKTACTAICVCLMEALARTDDMSEIQWEEKVLNLGADLYSIWNRRNRRTNGAIMPFVEELFEVMKAKNGYSYSVPYSGILTSSYNKNTDTNVSFDIADVLKLNLKKEGDFCLITVRELTVLAWVDVGEFIYLFDSHGHGKIPPSEKAFYLRTDDIEKFIELFVSLYYIPGGGTKREMDNPDPNLNVFQAFKILRNKDTK